MLAGVLGPNQVQVTVSAEMDHDQIRTPRRFMIPMDP